MTLTRFLFVPLVLLVACREPPKSVAARAEPEASTRSLSDAVNPPPAPAAFDACRAILLLDEHDDVLAFTQDRVPALARVSHVACSIPIRTGSPHSIAVGDDGTIWSGAPDGRVVKIRARDGACEVTSLAPHQAGFASLNLTFSGGVLWAADDHGWGGDVQPSLGLARVDGTKLTLVGNPEHGSPWILAGTPTGMYGEPPSNIERVDVSKRPPTAEELTPFEMFAKGPGVPIAYFRRAIYLFQTTVPGMKGDVVRFDTDTRTSKVVLPSTRQDSIEAAGAAACASK